MYTRNVVRVTTLLVISLEIQRSELTCDLFEALFHAGCGVLNQFINDLHKPKKSRACIKLLNLTATDNG